MDIISTPIDDLLVFIPKKFEDSRGYFFESFNQQKFNQAVGKEVVFVQDNESLSSKNVMRGLHFQTPPAAQGKLVRVVSGAVFDVAVDLRKNSPTFGKWHGELLSTENNKLMWIPEGFAHGFLSLDDNTKFLYKCTNYYSPGNEQTIIWNDPLINIDWKISEPIISEKDKKGATFTDFITPF
ncbi:MAG TPA: dTDP-4-dehydrorhamnose 3,5-epimerase [Taishania sp.]|nr:dTDP-4-dehydrorhamnose 3,5-epimerase [Taishania sp.]HNS41970.1 dTDP-4-dehydrorhamnose 3,5-epimerase [Taishania sp.]